MNKKVEKILQKYKNKRAGVFIDDARRIYHIFFEDIKEKVILRKEKPRSESG